MAITKTANNNKSIKGGSKNIPSKSTKNLKSHETEDIIELMRGFKDINVETYDPEPYFQLLDLYFSKSKHVLVEHHIRSYDQLIEEMIPSIVSGENKIYEKYTDTKIIRYRLTFDDIGIKPPCTDNDETLIFPLDALQKSLPYSSKVTATVTQWQDVVDIASGETVTTMVGKPEKDVLFAKIPMMVGSKYCNLTRYPMHAGKHCKYDAGGYFIINGNEKVVVTLSSMIQRKPMVFIQKDQTSLVYTVRVQSRPSTQFVGNTQVFKIKLKKDNSMVVTSPRFDEISVFTLMRALGLETDEDIERAIADPSKNEGLINQLSISMNTIGAKSMSREEAIEILMVKMKAYTKYTETDPEVRAQQRRAQLMRILNHEILPHVTSGTNNPDIDMINKAYYIGYMVNKLLKCFMNKGKEVEEYRGCDDRDAMINKRFEVTGTLLGGLFDQFFKKMLNDVNKVIKNKSTDIKKPISVIPNIKPNAIEQGLRNALSTGTFGVNRKGVSQMLNRTNHLHSTSYMRRVITPTQDASSNKLTGPRHLHNQNWGSMCPLETPEGAKTGLVNNLSMLVTITTNMNSQVPIIMRYLKDKITTLDSVNNLTMHNQVKVFVDNNWIGITNNIIKIHNDLREMRFSGELMKMVSLVFKFSEKEFHIYTEGGRIIRPYLTVTNNKLNFKPEMLSNVKTWDELLMKYPKVIEYIDKEEEQNIMLAAFPQYIEEQNKIMKMKPLSKKLINEVNRTNRYDGVTYVRYTHCEIHPSMILGLISSNIPFPNHNQSPRGIFQYNQARQAMGLYTSDFLERFDISYILYFPQLPIVAPRTSKYTGSHIFPAGQNSLVMIASYTGYNQEDSQLMNLSSIERGFMRAQTIKKYYQNITKNPASSQTGTFMKPDRSKVDNMKDADYSKLNDEGYADVETRLFNNDVIIGMVNHKPSIRPNDKMYKDNSTLYKSLVPGAVDKVIKGIGNDGYPFIKMRVRSERIPNIGDKFCSRHGQKGTIGFKIRKEDMPFTLNGHVPDIIINPNCIPKRMTIGQMIECLLSRVCVVKGIYGDATPFTGVNVEKINDELVKLGMSAWGNEVVYNGLTGKKMDTEIFFGPTYYQRLKQMVGDKAHSRARGPTQLLTRQAPEGRTRDGGLRVGEMERDAIMAHGCAQFLREKMYDCSDAYMVHVCDKCGLIAHRAPGKKHYVCKVCQNTTDISKIAIPYAFKLFLQELRSINILPRLRTPNSIDAS